ncbi:hypothetical protein B0T18DRAFT_385595 [Schizothecium vesticola]|uniref:RING-type domain-containing protein n=1 Tax=Schizothecium vesticola TaxID=314040 RepID=A0AA40F9A1_9PEZI|nr:hypothetical protein B0T18DRAFT_385595 [Schizothecium vesticola]
MRPPRVAILVLFSTASLFLFCRFITTSRRQGPAIVPLATPKSKFRAFFTFHAPFSLFPPSAAISLTDDNSTFFPARPAAFGPSLPTIGLSGQLWIGSGFAEDTLQEGEGEGELGCSDVAGWEDGRMKMGEQGMPGNKLTAPSVKAKGPQRADQERGPRVGRRAATQLQPRAASPHVDDGTDDYLHQGLQQTKPKANQPTSNLGSSHADIQSIQETAEITGKTVLLSRGGCGFLEKVKWAQRRGAIALIVGDNQKGGPLIQMFARGNVDNVTIPSVFTSWTTAHLLSSLMHGNPILKVQQQSGKSRKSKPNKEPVPTAPPAPKTTSKPLSKVSSSQDAPPAVPDKHSRRGWISQLLHWGAGESTSSDRSRPPSSGRLDWVIVDEWNDEKDRAIKSSLDKASSKHGSADTAPSHAAQDDGFQIGVQDWRDPDLVGPPSDGDLSAAPKDAAKPDGTGVAVDANGPKGGSITPGSGEYAAEPAVDPNASGSGKSDGSSSSPGGGLISKIFGDDDDANAASNAPSTSAGTSGSLNSGPEGGDDSPRREGLWVTIAPSSYASSFFDTLLVLVVSPLITLTVVYALLMLRAKIRRRRWRAPKSVVERLPVRTYQTVAPSPSPSPPKLPSPTTSSPSTPLLQGSSSRPRPRSRTTTGVPESSDLLRADGALQASKANPREKASPRVSSEWKKYMGRQVECVVCLEEYVDGVSRVMGLPCGHEFHVECITPWLTTRRRTCPICKGDVVRSLARGSPSVPRYEPYHDDSDDDVEASGSGLHLSSSSAEAEFDAERRAEQGGVVSSTARLPGLPNRPDCVGAMVGRSDEGDDVGPLTKSPPAIMAEQLQSNIIRNHPIGQGLDNFRHHFHGVCGAREAQGVVSSTGAGPASTLSQLDDDDLLDLAAHLLQPLSFLPAAARLPSTTGLGTLQNDLLRLLLSTVTGGFDLNLERIKPLLIAAIDTTSADSAIWAQASFASAGFEPTLCCEILTGGEA